MPTNSDLILQGVSEIKTDMRGVYDRLGRIESRLSGMDERVKQCDEDREGIKQSIGKINKEIYGEPGRDDGIKERTGLALSIAQSAAQESKTAKTIALIGAAGGSVGGGGLIAKLMGLI